MTTLALQTLCISLIMGFACALPLWVRGIQAYSRILLLIGTGGLASLLVYDLIPDVWEMGGARSLLIMAIAWAAFTLGHSAYHVHASDCSDEHGGPEHSREHQHDHGSSVTFLMTSMTIHCFTSGILLALARDFSAKMAFTFFLAMLAHKGYEALSVSMVLHQRLKGKKRFALHATAYAASFPAGVAFVLGCDRLFGAQVTPAMMKGFTMVVASVAIGSLIGCMIHDFVMPAYRQIRSRAYEAGWVVLGVLLTLFFANG